MNLFLDTCVIIGYVVDTDPQHKVVGNFIKKYGVDLESNVTTCRAVVDEIKDDKYKIIRRKLKKSKRLSNEDITSMVKSIDRYLTKIIEIIDYSYEQLHEQWEQDIYKSLKNDIKFDLEEEPTYYANMSDIEIFSNFIIWSIKHSPVPEKPAFLTTDGKDYDRTDNEGNSIILNSVKNCFNKASVPPKNPLELAILKKNEIKWYN